MVSAPYFYPLAPRLSGGIRLATESKRVGKNMHGKRCLAAVSGASLKAAGSHDLSVSRKGRVARNDRLGLP